MLLHRHRAIIWYAFGVAWLNSREVGLFERLCFVLECGLVLSFCTEAYPCLSKLTVSLKLRKVCVYLGVMLLHRHRAITWYAFGVAWLISRELGLL